MKKSFILKHLRAFILLAKIITPSNTQEKRNKSKGSRNAKLGKSKGTKFIERLLLF